MSTRTLLALALLLPLAAAAAAEGPSTPAALRVLGPLPLPPAAGAGLLAPSTELVPEIDATVVDPGWRSW
jgi:hypothetical protein